MAYSQNNKSDDSVFTWVLLSAFIVFIMISLLWLVAAHKVVYHLSPIVDFLGSIWKVFPSRWTGTMVNDLEVIYQINMLYPSRVSFFEWIEYNNMALRPYAVMACVIYILLYFRQIKKISAAQLNQSLKPNELSEVMMQTFTDIAPVVHIQNDLVANKIKGWERQVFPHEFIENAKHQGQGVLVPDAENQGMLVFDRERMNAFLKSRRKYKHNGVVLYNSKYLGRQIVDIIKDVKNKNVVFPDRLSNEGKAIFAILAPYAFGGGKGKAESKEVSDALNLSAYGTKDGKANLSVQAAQKSFNKWRKHRLAMQLGKVHHWEYTYLWALLEYARRSGKIGTWSFIWLRPMNRVMFAALNTTGRKTPHSEAGLAHTQFQFERRCARRGYLPITEKGNPRIFTAKLLKSLEEEWEFWTNADEDDDNWWQEDSLLENAHLADALRSVSQIIDLPPDDGTPP